MLLDYKCGCQKLLETSFIKRTARLRADKVLLHLVLDGSGTGVGGASICDDESNWLSKSAENP